MPTRDVACVTCTEITLNLTRPCSSRVFRLSWFVPPKPNLNVSPSRSLSTQNVWPSSLNTLICLRTSFQKLRDCAQAHNRLPLSAIERQIRVKLATFRFWLISLFPRPLSTSPTRLRSSAAPVSHIIAYESGLVAAPLQLLQAEADEKCLASRASQSAFTPKALRFQNTPSRSNPESHALTLTYQSRSLRSLQIQPRTSQSPPSLLSPSPS
jgi:hypothetical protein